MSAPLHAIEQSSRAINISGQSFGLVTAADAADPYHLHFARGGLVRALMPPVDREREIRATAHRVQLLQMRWWMTADDAQPGAFSMPDRRSESLDRIGIDPEVLR